MSSFLTPPDPEEDPRDDAQRWEDIWKERIAVRDAEILLLRTQIGSVLNMIDTKQIPGLMTCRELLASINYDSAVRATKRAESEDES